MYEFRQVILRNSKVKKKVLVVDFKDPDMQIIGEFLMADAGMLGGDVVVTLEEVLRGDRGDTAISGNRCALTITSTTTVVEDLLAGQYDDVPGLPAYTLDTALLLDITSDWLETRRLFYEQEEQ